MKKFRYVLLVLLLVISAFVLSACVSVNEIIHIDEVTETAQYYLYRVNDSKKYLQFLENFNNEKFEIVDISVSSGEYVVVYSITYRRK